MPRRSSLPAIVIMFAAASCKTPPPPPVVVTKNIVNEKKTMREAHRLYLEGNYRAALGPLNAILEAQGPSKAEGEAAYWAGFCCLKLGEYFQAIQNFQMAIGRLKSPHLLGPAYVGSGDSYLGRRDYKQAYGYYEKALKFYSRFLDESIVKQKMKQARSYFSGPVTSLPPPPPRPVPKSPKTETGTAANKGNFTLQAGAFEKYNKAKILTRRIRQAGLAPYILLTNRKGKKLYCVRVGKFSSRGKADEKKKLLKSLGFDSFVVQ